MRPILDFDDAGASDDEPARGVTVGDIRAWHDAFEEEKNAVSRVWAALGISTYEQAGGKAIWEIVAEHKQAIFDLGYKAAGGAIYSISPGLGLSSKPQDATDPLEPIAGASQ